MSEEASHEAETREAAATAPQRLVSPWALQRLGPHAACTPLPRWQACCCPSSVSSRAVATSKVDPRPCRKLPCSDTVGWILSARGVAQSGSKCWPHVWPHVCPQCSCPKRAPCGSAACLGQGCCWPPRPHRARGRAWGRRGAGVAGLERAEPHEACRSLSPPLSLCCCHCET